MAGLAGVPLPHVADIVAPVPIEGFHHHLRSFGHFFPNSLANVPERVWFHSAFSHFVVYIPSFLHATPHLSLAIRQPDTFGRHVRVIIVCEKTSTKA